MTNRRTPSIAQDGYQPRPNVSTHGYQPIAVAPNTAPAQGGHTPTTSQGGNSTPPNQGSGGKKG